MLNPSLEVLGIELLIQVSYQSDTDTPGLDKYPGIIDTFPK